MERADKVIHCAVALPSRATASSRIKVGIRVKPVALIV